MHIRFTYSLMLLQMSYCLAQQKNISRQTQIWYQYFVTAKLNPKWAVVADGGFRTKDWDKAHTFLIRAGIRYNISSRMNTSCGYALFISYPSSNNTNHAIPEHRGWQRLTLVSQYGLCKIEHRYRLEERFFRKSDHEKLLPGYRFNYRAGYQINLQIPLKGDQLEKGTPFIILYDELLLNFGKQIIYNYFDQNRIYAGFGYVFGKSSSCTLGYQHVWRQRSSGNFYEDINSIRLNFISNF